MLSRRSLLTGLALMPVVARAAESYAIEPEMIAQGIWMVRGTDAPIQPDNGGAIANIAIVDTPAGAVLIDCGPSLRYGLALKRVAEGLTGKPHLCDASPSRPWLWPWRFRPHSLRRIAGHHRRPGGAGPGFFRRHVPHPG